MSWAVTNLRSDSVRLGSSTIPGGGSVVVETLTDAMKSAAARGIISYTENATDTNGITSQTLPFDRFTNPNGTSLAAAAAAGVFGFSLTLGTSAFLVGEAAQGNTKTSIALHEIVLPATYVPGTDFTITVNTHHTGAGTAGTRTIDCEVFKNSGAGVSGADICATAARNFTNAAANYTFTVTGAGLLPGDSLILRVTQALQETGGASTLTGRINSVKIS